MGLRPVCCGRWTTEPGRKLLQSVIRKGGHAVGLPQRRHVDPHTLRMACKHKGESAGGSLARTSPDQDVQAGGVSHGCRWGGERRLMGSWCE